MHVSALSGLPAGCELHQDPKIRMTLAMRMMDNKYRTAHQPDAMFSAQRTMRLGAGPG